MTRLTCTDCDSPGDGNCSVCHGKGTTLQERLFGSISELVDASPCAACSGSGHCPTCGGVGEMEVGGEAG